MPAWHKILQNIELFLKFLRILIFSRNTGSEPDPGGQLIARMDLPDPDP
jgi:hypothetical protein